MAPFAGYPFSLGGWKSFGLLPGGHAGPVLYTVMTWGPLAGGDVVYARDFGLTWLENVFSPGLTQDGLYWVDVAMPVSGPAKSAPLLWTVQSTGAQAAAVNLSASIINLAAVGF